MTAQKQPTFKFRLEHKGIVVAESDWSSILFAQKNKRPEKSTNYVVFNNVTGLVAGTPSTKAAQAPKKPARRTSVKR